MTEEPSPSVRAGNARRILVVDDNVDVAEGLRVVLEIAGHKAAVATDAVQALELAGATVPDIVILDIELPVMDGYELALRLRSLPQLADCLFIALTGYSQSHDGRQSRESGFQHHLVKPVDVDRLLKIVATRPPRSGVSNSQVEST
jgi:CheY-like chemotaxis protein